MLGALKALSVYFKAVHAAHSYFVYRLVTSELCVQLELEG